MIKKRYKNRWKSTEINEGYLLWKTYKKPDSSQRRDRKGHQKAVFSQSHIWVCGLDCFLDVYTFLFTSFFSTVMYWDRKNETDYIFCSFLSSYLRHPKPSFHCVRKLVTILNSLCIKTRFRMSPNNLKEFYKWCFVSFFLPIPVLYICVVNAVP